MRRDSRTHRNRGRPDVTSQSWSRFFLYFGRIFCHRRETAVWASGLPAAGFCAGAFDPPC